MTSFCVAVTSGNVPDGYYFSCIHSIIVFYKTLIYQDKANVNLMGGKPE